MADTSAELTTVVPPRAEADRHIAVFYLHGGGLVYGERDDLPAPYVRAFADAGYTLVCADYPLAPESALPETAEALFSCWEDAIARPIQAGELDGYFLFGRSAGAYLALVLAREIRRRAAEAPLPQPLGILSFYGYYDLTDPALREPAKAYVALPAVAQSTVAGMIGDEPVTSGPKPLRYALYVYARQHEGAWLDLMGLDASTPERTPMAWSLTTEDIETLPPLFVAASSGDEDVPLRISKTLARLAPHAVMKIVYFLPHDFDRDVTDPAGMQVYQQALAWMAQQG
ncbi:alpha/beta hydrolase [Enorma phocaeensis]|uniref:alpha/beta hydrolase n=1 Tax=Enorma phocaeensis TaxID=1871019 RepID=UPI00320AE5A0